MVKDLVVLAPVRITMAHKEWTSSEVEAAVKASGRPLEVAVAREFLAKGWEAELSTYFEENNRLPPDRELDVLATRSVTMPKPLGATLTCQVKVCVSCKGFRPTQTPVAYTVSELCVPSAAPRFLSVEHSRMGRSFTEVGKEAASLVIATLQVEAAAPIVALDILDDKSKEGPRIVGDRDLFNAVDSAIKAAQFWASRAICGFHVGICIPLVVLHNGWWQVAIDDGRVGAAARCGVGRITCRYPSSREIVRNEPMLDMSAILVSLEQLPRAIEAFDRVFSDLKKKCVDDESGKW